MEFAGGVDMGLSFNGTYYVESDKKFSTLRQRANKLSTDGLIHS